MHDFARCRTAVARAADKCSLDYLPPLAIRLASAEFELAVKAAGSWTMFINLSFSTATTTIILVVANEIMLE